MVKTSCTKPSSPLMSTLFQPYLIPSQGLLTMAHVCMLATIQNCNRRQPWKELALDHVETWNGELRQLYIYTRIEYNTISYYTILYYTILYYTILYYTILYDTIRYDTIRYDTILYYTIRYDTILYYTVLCYTLFDYIIDVYICICIYIYMYISYDVSSIKAS